MFIHQRVGEANKQEGCEADPAVWSLLLPLGYDPCTQVFCRVGLSWCYYNVPRQSCRGEVKLAQTPRTREAGTTWLFGPANDHIAQTIRVRLESYSRQSSSHVTEESRVGRDGDLRLMPLQGGNRAKDGGDKQEKGSADGSLGQEVVTHAAAQSHNVRKGNSADELSIVSNCQDKQ